MGKRSRADGDAAKEHKHKSKKDKKSKSKSKSHKRSKHSDSEEAVPDFVADLKGVRVAAEYIRAILKKWPSLKQQLRDLLWKMDNGEAVDISGLADAQLRGALRACFDYLNLHITSQGAYAVKKGQDKILRRVGFVLMEILPDESDKPLRLPGDPALDAPPPATNGGGVPAHQHSDDSDDEKPLSPAAGAEAAEAAPPGQERSAAGGSVVLAAPAGPAAPRVLGPEAPAPELLDAAAEAAAEMREEGLLEEIAGAMGGDEAAGPAPPAATVAQLAGVGQAPRVLEVLRIMGLVDAATRAGDEAADPYAVLGLESAASASEVKKTFWRLSLLIHPDKCAHDKAHAAFQAVSAAAKALQDSGVRAAIDERREDARLNAAAAELIKEEAAQRKWRILRGTATAEDLRADSAPEGPAKRDEWMTALPGVSERRPAYLAQKSVTQFSQQGVQPTVHDAGWAAAPGGAASAGPHLLGASAGPAALAYNKMASAEDSIAAKNRALLAKVAAAEASPEPEVAQERPKSLLEQHQEALKQEAKEAKRRKKAEKAQAATAPVGPSAPKPVWEEEHPWRPFDREKDLVKPEHKSAWDKLKDGSSSLSSRFHKAT